MFILFNALKGQNLILGLSLLFAFSAHDKQWLMTRDVFGILTDGYYNGEFAMHDTGEIKVLFTIKGYLSIADG